MTEPVTIATTSGATLRIENDGSNRVVFQVGALCHTVDLAELYAALRIATGKVAVGGAALMTVGSDADRRFLAGRYPT
jgi:hypothetical protein